MAEAGDLGLPIQDEVRNQLCNAVIISDTMRLADFLVAKAKIYVVASPYTCIIHTCEAIQCDHNHGSLTLGFVDFHSVCS